MPLAVARNQKTDEDDRGQENGEREGGGDSMNSIFLLTIFLSAIVSNDGFAASRDPATETA